MDYCELAEQIYLLIDSEFKAAEEGGADLAEVYPKLVICCEFFRYIRGEFFYASRPYGLECQKRMYWLENQFLKRLQNLRKRLDISDSKVAYYLDLSKKLFD